MGTGTFVVVWARLSRSVTGRPPKPGLVLQIEIVRPVPCSLSKSVTGRDDLARQMLHIETEDSSRR